MEFVDFSITIPKEDNGTEEVTLSLPRVEMREEDIIELYVIRTSNFMFRRYDGEIKSCTTKISKLQLGCFIMALAEATKYQVIYFASSVTPSTTVILEIYDDYRE